jgi:methenyltetrahydrofolate cyclohydrolase
MWEGDVVTGGDPLLDVTVRDLLVQVAADDRSPGGGAVAALSTALAAGLVEAAAVRGGDDWPDGAEVARLAREARERAAPLAAVNAAAYRDALAAMAEPADGASAKERNAALGEALARAAEVPLEITTIAEEVAELGAIAAECGRASLRPDAVAATLLAGAAAAAAANLVAVNLAVTDNDPRARRAHGLAHDATRALARALAAAREP